MYRTHGQANELSDPVVQMKGIETKSQSAYDDISSLQSLSLSVGATPALRHYASIVLRMLSWWNA
jgi:hypothetical protein